MSSSLSKCKEQKFPLSPSKSLEENNYGRGEAQHQPVPEAVAMQCFQSSQRQQIGLHTETLG